MRVRYAVTLEFDTAPPLTHRGEVAASTVETVVKRAVRSALKAYPGKTWTSFVVVLLERLPDEDTVESPKSEAVVSV